MSQEKAPEIVPLSSAQLEELLAQLQVLLPAPIYQKVQLLLRTLQWCMACIQGKTTTIGRLRHLLFGPKTEKTKQLFPKDPPASGQNGQPKTKREGHGRKGAASYTGAKKNKVTHPTLHAGCLCPQCARGKLYLLKTPARLIRLIAQPIIQATLHELERLRCALCGAIFTAPTPPETLQGKFHDNVGPMLGYLRYGAGLPMYRLEKLQNDFGVPLPASTQWELIEAAAQPYQPAWEALQTYAAQGHLVHNDDTNMRVQSLRQEIQEQNRSRTGIFTTSIISQVGPRYVALFFTGQKHAGENLDEILKRRAASLPPPIQMCDALSRNPAKEFKTILANCLPHGRREFVEIAEHFPAQCQHVLESLGEVFKHDAQAREHKLSPQDRLIFHQEKSGPIMESLQAWMQEQLEQKQVEPNSGLGKAYNYMLKHWPALTLFLRQAGAPLDNNICERALKTAIQHRKNSLSYKTENGARIGDLFMSLIHTCRLNEVNPYAYLLALTENAKRVLKEPGLWLPWNYPRPALPTDTG